VALVDWRLLMLVAVGDCCLVGRDTV